MPKKCHRKRSLTQQTVFTSARKRKEVILNERKWY